jgi:hypothetical protein
MENEATTKTPTPTRSAFRSFALCTLIFAFSIRRRSTTVETPLQISLFSAKQSQFQNGQYKHKYSNTKGLCQRTTNNEQRMLFKTNPIKPNSPPDSPSVNALRDTLYEKQILIPAQISTISESQYPDFSIRNRPT